MSDTTSIFDLPTNPLNGGENISISVKEQPGSAIPNNISSSNPEQSTVSLDQTTINQIINGLQQASTSGLTQLQSRDIPQTTENLIKDPQIQPNYIPQSSNQDYIRDYEDNENIIDNYNKNISYNNNLDQIYEELQTPLLISILFFLFQLPIFKKLLSRHLPILFSKDGNINIYGYTFTSVFFGFVYYVIEKFVTYFNTF
jgi:hypothetical protein